jgi:hypothetical protein
MTAVHWDAVIETATGLLAPAERDTAVLYLLQEVQPGGHELALDGTVLRRPYDVVVFFVDLEPGRNWAHRCRYIVMDARGDHCESIDARWPPFLRSVPPSLRLVWKGGAVPDWAIATSTRPDRPAYPRP